MPKLEISQDIIELTTKCHSNFSCLNDEENPKCPDGLALCPVENEIGKDTVFVNFDKDHDCAYSTFYGTENRICLCPVRNEIYKLYAI